MKVKLPKPLPYDYVDQLIDSSVRFILDRWVEEDVKMRLWIGYPVDEEAGRSTFAREMFEVLDEGSENGESEVVKWSGYGSAMRWKAEELTEEEINEVLEGIF